MNKYDLVFQRLEQSKYLAKFFSKMLDEKENSEKDNYELLKILMKNYEMHTMILDFIQELDLLISLKNKFLRSNGELELMDNYTLLDTYLDELNNKYRIFDCDEYIQAL